MTDNDADIEHIKAELHDKESEYEEEIKRKDELYSLLKPDYSNLDDIAKLLATCDKKLADLSSRITELNLQISQNNLLRQSKKKEAVSHQENDQRKYYLKPVWEKIDKLLGKSLNLKIKIIQEILDLNVDEIHYPEQPISYKVNNYIKKEGLHVLAQGIETYHDRRRILYGVAFQNKTIVCEACFADHQGKDKPECDAKRDELNTTSLNNKYATIGSEEQSYWGAESLISWISASSVIAEEIKKSKTSRPH